MKMLSLYSPVWPGVVFMITVATMAIIRIAIPDVLPMTNARTRVGEVDGLRGILALSIFLTHAATSYRYHIDGIWTWAPSRFYEMLGVVPVSLFFMITGFLFWNKCVSGRLFWRDLYIDRVFRILPLYWLLLLSIFIYIAFSTGWGLHQGSKLLVLNLAKWITLAARPDDINGFTQTNGMATSVWTLRPEMIFYAMLPLFAFARRPIVFAILAVAALSATFWGYGFLGNDIHVTIFVYFIFGMATAQVRSRVSDMPVLRRWPSSLISIAAIAVSLTASWPIGYHILGALLTFPFFLCVIYGNSIFGILKLRPLRDLGEISFSIYLIHCFLLFVSFNMIGTVFPMRHVGPNTFWLCCTFIAVALICLSTLSFRLIEQKGIALGRRFRLRYATRLSNH